MDIDTLLLLLLHGLLLQHGGDGGTRLRLGSTYLGSLW
jgi:hypothetical protein